MSHTRASVALFMLLCHWGWGTVTMEMTTSPTEIIPGESFEISFTMVTDSELVGGVTYQLGVEAAGSGLMTIAGRDIGASPVSEVTSTSAEVTAFPGAVLDPVNDRDLGGLTPVDTGPAGPGTIYLSTVTIASDPLIPVGSYTLTLPTLTAYNSVWPFDVYAVEVTPISITVNPKPHHADQNGDWMIQPSPELTRLIQFYNSGGYHCQPGTEDGFAPGPGDTSCEPHNADQNADWKIQLSPELTRLVQFYNSGGYHVSEGTEDGFAPGPAPP